VDLTDLRQLPAEGRQLSILEPGDIAEFSVFGLEEGIGLTIPSLLVIFCRKQLNPIFERSLGTILIDGGIERLARIFLLIDKGIQIVHRLNIEELH
jgi:hypothetical protein